MRDFQALRSFAVDAIPPLLQERGGEMSKAAMHEEVERRFAGGRDLPDALERVGRGGCSAKRNAVAWALHDLVVRRVVEPSTGRRTVRLRNPAERDRRLGDPDCAGPSC